MRFLLLLLSLVLVPPAVAQETETLLLSGSGSDATVDWEFRCDVGRGCGEWTTIAVPSNWEQQGFGAYDYGHDEDKAEEIGEYRVRFEVPPEWSGRTIDLVFEGVMTDAAVRVNGRSAGPTHRGGFYRFRYDVAELLQAGENLLEVEVRKKSEDRSVELAERDADYWVFGGIYRPVSLRALPREAIDAVAIDARHDGVLLLQVEPRGVASAARLETRVLDDAGVVVAELPSVEIVGDESAELAHRVVDAATWSAENPRLHTLEVRLMRGEETLHLVRERFGFRSVEIRGDGLYVNDRRVLLKGVNRHAFWPDTGRALNRDLDEADARLIKSMNFNAVRMSHYPPDKSFLEICDEIGLYVIDELTGWHDAYSTEVGEKLVREMVERDRNHPSILFWANGNEDGWNTDLDDDFAIYDLQNRVVLHPDENFGGIDTKHYLTWEELESGLSDDSWKNRFRGLWNTAFGDDDYKLPLVMPTEVLHGLYDGGHGAGLDDYWDRIRTDPRGAGLFLWVFSDESIVRTDRGGELDSDGNHAPDGIVGPYRESSANVSAIRRTFSPIVLLENDPVLDEGKLYFENRFEETDLADARIVWTWLRFPEIQEDAPSELTSGELTLPSTSPGDVASVEAPPGDEEADALRLDFYDPSGRLLDVRTIPRLDVRRQAPRWVVKEGDADVRFEDDGRIVVDGRVFPLGENLRMARQDDPPKVVSVREDRDGSAILREMTYDPGASGGLERVLWRVESSGWVRLSYSYRAEEGAELHGVALPFDEDSIESITWLGVGPGRQWANRLQGGDLGVWTLDPASSVEPEVGHEPMHRGYRKTYWARLETADGALGMVLEGDDMKLGLFAPRFPDDAEEARAASPAADGLLFMHRIPAVGTKFYAVDELGPQSSALDSGGIYQGVVWFVVLPPAEAESMIESESMENDVETEP